jgi:hypothetical protein
MPQNIRYKRVFGASPARPFRIEPQGRERNVGERCPTSTRKSCLSDPHIALQMGKNPCGKIVAGINRN